MLVLITYDVRTSSVGGSERLRKVAKVCQNYGQRVQNSVFECNVDATQLTVLRKELCDLIDKERDSLRFYNLGNKYQAKIMHYGVKPSLDFEEPLIF
ncbi:MAG: CRISPR-associated endonuclease Cas2 [Peptococcia bacterium]